MHSDLFNPLPWQKPLWSTIVSAAQSQQLGHALLFAGPSGLGKLHFAKALAAYLLCDRAGQASAVACGECSSCRIYANSVHADFLALYPEDSGKQIKVDRVRELVDFVAKTAQRSGRKVVIVHPTEALNVNAANALLKSLEEPTANTILILVTDNPGLLLPTIRSRCQVHSFPVVETSLAQDWLLQQFEDSRQVEQMLKVTDNRPLVAQQMLQGDGLELRQTLIKSLLQFSKGRMSVVQVAKLWLELESHYLFFWLQCWSADMVKCKAVQQTQALKDEGMLSVYEQWLSRASFQELMQLQSDITRASAAMQSRANPNKQLLLEKLLISWGNCLHL